MLKADFGERQCGITEKDYCLLIMLSMFSIGLLVGGLASNMKTASALASLLYFPMLIFSGATLPYEVMPVALQKVADILLLTQGIKLLKTTSLGLPVERVFIPVVVMIALAVICMFRCGFSSGNNGLILLTGGDYRTDVPVKFEAYGGNYLIVLAENL